jgi:hypothetical protein
MTENSQTPTAEPDVGLKLVYWLTVAMVIIGLINMTPGIPGYDDLAESLTGIQGATFRKFPFEWFYPSFFALMMLIVALKHSMWRSWAEASRWRRRFGLFMDIALVLMAATISVTYFVEIEAICLIDQITGDRARLIEESLKAERELAELLGMEPPTTIDDPKCVNNTGGWLVLIAGLAIIVFLSYNIKVWGLPLVLVAILIAAYTIITVLVWYVHGPDDINKYLMTKLAGEPRMLADGRPRVHDILVNNSSGLLGRFMDIILNTIFPYLVLGSLFGSSAGGRSLIKLAFRWTRHLRGGPAHAAVVSSAMFGTISGGPIVNVLSTGVLTIPMMLKRGFSKVFAGGVEAAASSGGSVMPPVMGVDLCPRLADQCSLFGCHRGGGDPGAGLFLLPVPVGHLPVAQAGHPGHWQADRRYAPRPAGHAESGDDLRSHPADPVAAADEEGSCRVRHVRRHDGCREDHHRGRLPGDQLFLDSGTGPQRRR